MQATSGLPHKKRRPSVKERPQQLLLPQPRHPSPPRRDALAKPLGLGQVGEEVLATALAVSSLPRCGLRVRLVCGHLLLTAFPDAGPLGRIPAV